MDDLTVSFTDFDIENSVSMTQQGGVMAASDTLSSEVSIHIDYKDGFNINSVSQNDFGINSVTQTFKGGAMAHLDSEIQQMLSSAQQSQQGGYHVYFDFTLSETPI